MSQAHLEAPHVEFVGADLTACEEVAVALADEIEVRLTDCPLAGEADVELVRSLRLCAWMMSVAEANERASLVDELERMAGRAHLRLTTVARSPSKPAYLSRPPQASEPPPVSGDRIPRAPLISGWVSLEELATWDDDETVVRTPKWDASHSTNRVLSGKTSIGNS